MSFAVRSSVTGLIDESCRRVARELPREAGWLILASLPLRFLEAQMLTRASALEPEAGTGGAWAYLGTLSLLVTLALVPALWARLVFVRAATAVRAGRFQDEVIDGGRAVRVPRVRAASFLGALVLTLAAQSLLYWGALTFLAVPFALALAALAAAASPYFEVVGPWRPWRELGRSAPPFRFALGFVVIFALALGIVWFNLFVAFYLLQWLAGAVAPGFDEAWWSAVLAPGNHAFSYLLWAGGVLLVEPFWLAAWSAAVGDRRARDTGDDLAAWFTEIRADASGERS